jgi:fibronectin-binding autotransporter adhesin
VIAGDLDLPALGAGYAWDLSAFKRHGVLVVVPEPGRALLLLLGLAALVMRRRRNA